MARYSTPLHVDEDALRELEEYALTNPDKAKRERAAMVLECAKGKQVMEVAAQLSKRPNSVIFWKERYRKEGLTGFDNKPRGKSKNGYGDDFDELLLSVVKEEPPKDSNGWTAKLLSMRLGVPVYAIHRHLKRNNISLSALKLTRGQSSEDTAAVPTPGADTVVEEKACDPMSDTVQDSTLPDDDPKAPATGRESSHLNIRITMDALDESGNVLKNTAILLPHILADLDHFDVSTLEGFRRDYGLFEQGSINGFVKVLRDFSDGFTDDVSKKKLTQEPDLPCREHSVVGEFTQFTLTGFGELTSKLHPGEIILTESQERIHLISVTNAGGTYRNAAKMINMMQHRTGGSEIQSRQLQDFVTRTGDEMSTSLGSDADTILEKYGFDPQTLLPRENGGFSTLIHLPDAQSSCVTPEMAAEAIARFNDGKDSCAQIKDMSLLSRMEANPDDAIYICDDDVGVNRQNEQRKVHGRKPFKSTKRVENTVIFIMRNKQIYRITSTNRFEAVKLALAFALENGLAEGAPLVFFSDGANNIRSSVENYFSFYPYTLNLDWYHCEKRIMQVGSMAFKGTKESKRDIYYEITKRLWPGNIDEALEYIDSLSPDLVKNQKQFNELKDYLTRKRPFLYCYALRKEMGYLNASSPVEKTNDLIVAQRQKHNGMSWSYSGSGSLAFISATILNGGLDSWIGHRQIALGFRTEPSNAA